MPKNLKGGGKSKKISEIIGELFSRKQDKIDYMPNSNIFVRNLTHKYINMITLSELRNIIDSNPNLKSSKTIMDIYNNKKLIQSYNNITGMVFEEFTDNDKNRYYVPNYTNDSEMTASEKMD